MWVRISLSCFINIGCKSNEIKRSISRLGNIQSPSNSNFIFSSNLHFKQFVLKPTRTPTINRTQTKSSLPTHPTSYSNQLVQPARTPCHIVLHPTRKPARTPTKSSNQLVLYQLIRPARTSTNSSNQLVLHALSYSIQLANQFVRQPFVQPALT